MKIVFASTNQGKILEISEFLKDAEIEIIPQHDLGVTEIPETGLSFVENALLKARHAAKSSNLPSIADDSGLVVPALQGAPGIYSARYAGEGASSIENNKKLLQQMSNLAEKNRHAYFYAVIVFLEHALDPTPIICEASWHGIITDQFMGEKGFGYDPIFFVPELQKTAAQLTLAEKNAVSHRGQALRSLLTKITEKS